jgi:cobalamin biosynthetic protein CobC
MPLTLTEDIVKAIVKKSPVITLPEHGGDLLWAATTFARPVDEWLDLSTGVSPWMYPIPKVPDTVWQTLPYDQQVLLQAAAQYYQCNEQQLISVSGSQAAIERLPALLAPSQVAIPEVAYREHEYAWSKAGHTLYFYRSMEQLQQLIFQKKVKHVVVVNPNNPTGAQYITAAFLD